MRSAAHIATAAPVPALPFENLSTLPRRRLARLRAATRELLAVLEEFSRLGRHPVRDLMPGTDKSFVRYEHYPVGDVDNPVRGYAWYYHAHDPSEARPWSEHGHFHCYAYTELLPDDASPIALPAEPDFAGGGLCHLVGLCVDLDGLPTRLFTINRWASDEWMYAAEDVIPLIDGFSIDGNAVYALTSRWLGAMLRILQPQIAWLLYERDRVLAARRAIDPLGFSEDQSIDVTSTLAFDLDAHITAIERARTPR